MAGAAPDFRLLALAASEMAALVRGGQVSPVDLVEASLAAIERLDPTLNAFCLVTVDQARAAARVLEGEAAAGRLRGPLHGVPIGVKDLFLTAGVRTGRGSRAFADFVPQESSPAVERSLAAGAIMIGKTTTPELGWKGTANSPLTGVTRNPWDPTRQAGGSSAGSAVAVSARMVPAALGTDGGGSVRIPAAFCGIFALKASLGRVPYYPASVTDMLSHGGPMTRTVLDTALWLDVLKGPDARDHVSLPAEPRSYVDALKEPLPRMRCAFAPTLFGVPVDPGVDRAVRGAVAAFSAGTGLPVEEVAPPLESPARTFETLWVAGRRSGSGALLDSHARDLDPGFANLIRLADRYTATDVFDALQARAAFCLAVAAFFERYDVLFLPTVPIPPFEAERDVPLGWPDSPGPIPWAEWTPFTPPFNLTGQPAASIPCGVDATGMPVGLQVVGRRFAEATVLAVCHGLERILPWQDPVPPLVGKVLQLSQEGPRRQPARPC